MLYNVHLAWAGLEVTTIQLPYDHDHDAVTMRLFLHFFIKTVLLHFSLCKNAMDPYCGWNKALSECTTAPDNNPSIHYWEQYIISCPIIEHPIDGVWSEWSPWEPCKQMVPDPSAGECLCRTRSCDNPKPAFRGKSCDGSVVEVTNCTGK